MYVYWCANVFALVINKFHCTLLYTAQLLISKLCTYILLVIMYCALPFALALPFAFTLALALPLLDLVF